MKPALLALSLFLGGVAQASTLAEPIKIDPAALVEHVRVLASDAFEGRAPATPGEQRTVDYLIAQFQKSGLQPGGEHGSWVQNVPLQRVQVEGLATATLQLGQQRATLVNGEDVTLQSLQPLDEVKITAAPLVFVGYGIHAPERKWDDYKGVNLRGKIMVVLVNDPDFESDAPGAFDGRALTYYGRWTYKFEEAARQGAAGVLIIHETAPAAYPWATVRASGTSPVFDIERSKQDAMAAHTPLRGWIQREWAQRLFVNAGLDFDTEKRKAMHADFKPVTLGDARLSVQFKLKHEQVVTRNVAAKLQGAVHPDETVIFSAHWDAFGLNPGVAGSDGVRHGAIDNATGIASILELARVFAAGPRPQRTLYFIALTAEEKGLLGASYYAEHPLVPLATTVADLNIEMFSPDGATADIATWGNGRVSLETDIDRIAQAHGRYRSLDPNLEAGFFYRADHFAFARKGVPAITFGAGLDKRDGGVAAGRALRDAYFANCYHQACDAWNAQWDGRGLAADTQLVYDLGAELANSRVWPQWQAESEFAPLRHATDAQRK